MKVALTIEVTDNQRRALTGKNRLATRDEVRAFVEGALGQLGASTDQGTAAHNPTVRAPAAPSANYGGPNLPPEATWSEALSEKVAAGRAKGWREDEVAAYVRGWFTFKSRES